MARLPTSGGDSGTWGDVLNTFLQVGHASTGENIGAVVEVTKSSGYTFTSADSGKRFVATASLTFSLPAVGTLGNGFEVEIVNDSGSTVTIDGPGSTNVTLDSGDVACILETNSKQRVVKGASTVTS
ncbi:MAG: hypothetical protein KBD00_00805 [Candidatus Peribacteraceae bacterium]|nr:hypothetical protein [Candidatus Peribacteraceae bacterium]